MPVTKDSLIAEIKRTAIENGSIPLGEVAFRRETGVSQASWRGIYWRNWGEAVQEAGYAANKKNEAFDQTYVVTSLVELMRKTRRFPTYADIRLEKRRNSAFPAFQAISRHGSHADRVELVRQFAKENAEWHDLLELLPASDGSETDSAATTSIKDGFVYLALLRIGAERRYKIGKTTLVERRLDQLKIQLPEDLELIHVIRTDDIDGIESYWHARFAEKRAKGEWFRLTRADIDAFKRRKFM